jgi:hypothetical protein
MHLLYDPVDMWYTSLLRTPAWHSLHLISNKQTMYTDFGTLQAKEKELQCGGLWDILIGQRVDRSPVATSSLVRLP